VARLRTLFGAPTDRLPERLPELPVRLRRTEVAAPYLEAEGLGDHQRAGVTAMAAAETAITAGDWWVADTWAHRALWHFEQGGHTLGAVRAARRIGDLRTAAGDPDSARRYYAEAISEARDIGAEREEGLAASGLARAEFDRGDVTTARKLADIAVGALERGDAPVSEISAARDLRGTEKPVGSGL
jgi:hypothetical protein